MTHRRGRPRREYRLRVRAERRTEIDFEALARAALEQAAMDQREGRQKEFSSASPQLQDQCRRRSKDVRYDRLA